MKITITGKVGEGKSTMAAFLKAVLEAKGFEVSVKDSAFETETHAQILARGVGFRAEGKKIEIDTVQAPRV